MGHVSYAHLAAAGSVTIGAVGSGTKIVSINVNTGTASSVVTVTDVKTGANVAVIDASAKGSYWYGGLRGENGFTVTMATANSDITISYV